MSGKFRCGADHFSENFFGGDVPSDSHAQPTWLVKQLNSVDSGDEGGVAVTPANVARSERFPAALAEVLSLLEVDGAFIADEVARMTEPVFSKTANRSVVGTLTEFCFLSEVDHPTYEISTLLELSLWLARVPCGALRKSHDFPD